jgi:hypothetical protein
MRARLSAILSIVGGLATALPGSHVHLALCAPRPARGTVRPLVRHPGRPADADTCGIAVLGDVRAWQRASKQAWLLQGAAGLVVLALVGLRSPAPLRLLTALLSFLEARSSTSHPPPAQRTP